MVANLLGIVIGIVLTAAIGGGLYLSTSGILDNASSIASIEIHNARAYNSGDAGYISMSIKNTGTEAATVTIAEILLDCSVANDGMAAVLGTGTECGDATAMAVPDPQVAGPGGLASADFVATDITMAPGATASMSGTIKTSVGATGVSLMLGEEYVIEVEGTAAGETIIQTAEVRIR